MHRLIRNASILATWIAALASGPVLADNVQPGDDPYQIDPSLTQEVFSGPTTIPLSFFEPNSDPFTGTVPFQGILIPAFPGCSGDLGLANVIIRRPSASNTPVVPSSDQIPIEIVALSLVSTNPITVTYNGGQNPELWEVMKSLSPTPSGPGSKDLHHSIPDGGTFDSQLPVRPQFTFRRLSDNTIRTLDAGAPAFSSFFDVFVEIDAPWRHTSDPSEVAQPGCKSNFTGSYDGDPQLSTWTGQHGRMGLRPSPPQRPVPSLAQTWGSVRATYR